MSDFVIPYANDPGTAQIPGHVLNRLQQKAAMFDYLVEHCTFLEDGKSLLNYWSSGDDRRPSIELADYLALRMTGEDVPALPPQDEATEPEQEAPTPAEIRASPPAGEWLDEPTHYRVCRNGVCEL